MLPRKDLMGFAALNPSYAIHRVTARAAVA